MIARRTGKAQDRRAHRGSAMTTKPRRGRAPEPGFVAKEHDHRSCVAGALDLAGTLCAQRGVRLTALRSRILELVWASHRPVGAYEILDALRDGGRPAAPPTVYRALDFLVEQGLVHRVQSLNAFVGCRSPASSHGGEIMVCSACGEAAELSGGMVADAAGRRAAEAGFRVERHTIELFGLCPSCRDAGDDGP